MTETLKDFASAQNPELLKARRERDEERAKASRLWEAAYQAVRDATEMIQVPPVPVPKADTRGKGAETAICVLSDWQLAKVTPSYSTKICEQRIQKYAEKVIELTEIQRADHPVKECRAYLLGDLVEGEMIFPGQEHRIDSSLYRQVVADGPRILTGLVRTLLANFEKVRVVGVIGNHGALGGAVRKGYHPESNADAMMYEVSRLLLRDEKRLEWEPALTSGERHWRAIDRVGAHDFFLFHGDQIRGGFAGFPWYGEAKKAFGWLTNHILVDRGEPFRYLLHGHFHTPARIYLNGLTIWANGSTESDNTWALEGLASAGEPCQWLLFAHPKRGVTAEYLVAL